MEKIIKIEGCEFKKDKSSYRSFEGFLISTDKQIIKIGISSGQCCCENSGYFMSEEDPKEFEGAELRDVRIVDTCLKDRGLPEGGLDEGGVMFVNFETDRGALQFVAYNAHNGYYGHDAVVLSEQLKREETL